MGHPSGFWRGPSRSAWHSWPPRRGRGSSPGPGDEGDGDDGDGYRPPFGAAAAAEHGLEMPGRGHVPEPRAPRLFRARAPDGGLVLHSQIAFGPEAGPSLAVRAGGRHAWTDVIMPLHWVLLDLRPVGWELVFRAAEDAARRLRAGEPVPPRYGADPAWGVIRCPDGPRILADGSSLSGVGSGREWTRRCPVPSRGPAGRCVVGRPLPESHRFLVPVTAGSVSRAQWRVALGQR